ncbi:hypothetical protein NP233_g1134 [Leucocoprinus birnbaumii]|uniref:Uncharacterized protein n=1 Tax=Leucocoprinus birnbaumii TaxID=56174 RepID=A0AAD5YY73_9AGAR|nr:hypothetical protein NP233_g1134 [Leucocoprinus birnbaumii]
MSFESPLKKIANNRLVTSSSFTKSPKNPLDLLRSGGGCEDIITFLRRCREAGPSCIVEYGEQILYRLSRHKLHFNARDSVEHEVIVAAVYPSREHYEGGTGLTNVVFERTAVESAKEEKEPNLLLRFKEHVWSPRALAYEAQDTVRLQTINDLVNIHHSQVSRITFPPADDCSKNPVQHHLSLWELLILAADVHHGLGNYEPSNSNCSAFAATLMQAAASWTFCETDQIKQSLGDVCRSCKDPRKRYRKPVHLVHPGGICYGGPVAAAPADGFLEYSVLSRSRERRARFMAIVSIFTIILGRY